jgi:hypothetical protein
MKCVLCDQRKGKRFCPAKNSVICAQCCGEKRVLEIDCPESCQYLQAGRERESVQEGSRHFRIHSQLEQERLSRVLENHEPVLAELQMAIAAERQTSRNLTDQDVAEALDCQLKTLRTEANGVLYETTSENWRAESLRKQFSSLIQALRYPEKPEQERIRLNEAIDCLEVLRSVVASHLSAGPSSPSFVSFLLRHVPRSSGTATPQSSIIIPGR